MMISITKLYFVCFIDQNDWAMFGTISFESLERALRSIDSLNWHLLTLEVRNGLGKHRRGSVKIVCPFGTLEGSIPYRV